MNATILIAEDEPNIVIALEFLLRRAGYAVRTAHDGEEALALMEACRPDLVLLDVMMPVRSGYEVCRTIRSRGDWRDIKVIMLSARQRDADVSRGLELGADAYLTKPFLTRELLAKIEHLLQPR